MILWGPPGSGKTTLARLMAKAFDANFMALSAVFSGVKDIREAVQAAQDELARSGRRTILFVDEVHRFNKAQQDAFLPFVEDGTLIFIGATTENPAFALNKRCCRARCNPQAAHDQELLASHALVTTRAGARRQCRRMSCWLWLVAPTVTRRALNLLEVAAA
jgi:putative ATPase